MKKIGLGFGKLIFWVSLPALWLYLRQGTRTRVLIICDDELLVLRGWLGSGKWTLPGGGLHKGENSLQGLIREVAEETNVALYEKDVKFLFKHRHRDTGLSFTYDCFVAHLAAKPAINLQKLEIADHAWVPISRPSLPLSKDALYALAQWQKIR